jgi:hypothetical protein
MARTNSSPTTRPARVIVVTGAQGGVDAGPTRVDDVFGGQSAQRDPTPVSPTTPQVRRHQTSQAAVRCASYRTVTARPGGRRFDDEQPRMSMATTTPNAEYLRIRALARASAWSARPLSEPPSTRRSGTPREARDELFGELLAVALLIGPLAMEASVDRPGAGRPVAGRTHRAPDDAEPRLGQAGQRRLEAARLA